MTARSSQRGCACGTTLRRSRARTLFEKLCRYGLRLRKYRCENCGETAWVWNGQQIWRQMNHVRKDPVARRVFARRWRRAIFIGVVAIASALALGQAVGRWQEAMSMSDPTP